MLAASAISQLLMLFSLTTHEITCQWLVMSLSLVILWIGKGDKKERKKEKNP
jgi:hypothetical protein